MSQAPPLGSAYIIAARRSALGRPGGLHRLRRLEALAAPVIEAALRDAKLEASRVDEIILGNTTAGGNPARLVGLAAGLSETAPALTVDRQCASGLDAIVLAARAVACGEAQVVVAGGAESLSTAPWRIAKPKTLFQTPRFISPDVGQDIDGETSLPAIAASEALAQRLGISRADQDGLTLRSHLLADLARDERRFIGEIVPLKVSAEENRDEGGGVPEIGDLAELDPLLPPDGTHTTGNSSGLRDGAAAVVIVSGEVYAELGRPPAMRMIGYATQGLGPGEEARAPIVALEKVLRPNGAAKPTPDIVELSEASAAQVIALSRALEFDDGAVNVHGGAVVRGYPLGAASAVSVVRLFTSLVRARDKRRSVGAVTQGAIGGLGASALFEAV